MGKSRQGKSKSKNEKKKIKSKRKAQGRSKNAKGPMRQMSEDLGEIKLVKDVRNPGSSRRRAQLPPNVVPVNVGSTEPPNKPPGMSREVPASAEVCSMSAEVHKSAELISNEQYRPAFGTDEKAEDEHPKKNKTGESTVSDLTTTDSKFSSLAKSNAMPMKKPVKANEKPKDCDSDFSLCKPAGSLKDYITRRSPRRNDDSDYRADVMMENEEIVKKWMDFMRKLTDKGNDFIADEYRKARTHLPQAATRKGFDENPNANRFIDIVCVDHTRVELSTGDYIHASWVDLPSKNKVILTQLPLRQTAHTFWQLVLEHSVQGILLFLTDYEARTMNFAATFPEEQDFRYFEENKYRVAEFKRVEIQKNWTMHVISVNDGERKRFIHLHHYTGWPHQQDLTDVNDLLKIQSVFKRYSYPHVYMSLSGCGRAGTFATFQAMHDGMHTSTNRWAVARSMTRVRNGRVHAVQRLSQFRTIHIAIGEHILSNGFLEKMSPEEQKSWREFCENRRD